MSILLTMSRAFALLVVVLRELWEDDPRDYQEKQKQGVQQVLKTYYFLIRASKFHCRGMSTITIPVSITVNADKYDKYDAQRFSLKPFEHLSQDWIQKTTSMTLEMYENAKAKYLVERDIIEAPVSYNVPNS